jgi:acetyl-CoA synthetase
MRRILRKIVAGEGDQLGDLSSIADPSIVDESECLLFLTIQSRARSVAPNRSLDRTGPDLIVHDPG